MTNISQSDFDPKTSHTMVEIATLLRAAQEMQAMSKTFKNLPDLNKKNASPTAQCVIKFTKEVSTGLLGILTKPKNKRDDAAREFRCSYREQLNEAILAAQLLSDREEKAVQRMGGGAKGNVIRKLVLEPLQALNW